MIATEPKTALAGAIVAASFAKSRPPMATLSQERVSFDRPSDSSVMVETQGGCEGEVWREGESEP